ncbi:hypothetical protein ACQE98_02050 [Ornithinimicrobium sp. W1679]|uniref:hypothetical protein n=1 Tax=Ornithinimicrobium sp. W1679 TaxID=3418770 RepID=UPI003CF665DD
MSAAVVGPAWTAGPDGRYPGRFPLAVERHAMAQVAHLIPGITTVTAHARYYTLHTAVFAEARARDLDLDETRRLLRRAEVVMGSISLVHRNADPQAHEGMRAPHGSDHISPRIAGGADIDALSADGGYAQAKWGFWNPYLASELGMGLLATEGNRTVPGPKADVDALRAGFDELFALAGRANVTTQELTDAAPLCICQGSTSPDGRMLRRVLIPDSSEPMHDDDRRAQTLRMLLRLTSMAADAETPKLDRLLVFGDGSDSHLGALDVAQAWTGVVLRNFTVAGWRNLWKHLLEAIEGFMRIDALGEAFAGSLPTGTVQSFVESRPDGMDATGPRPAEFSSELADLGPLERAMSQLVIGAGRYGHLDERAQAYFEAQGTEEFQQLTPSWLQARLAEWADRPLRDFAIWLTDQLVARAERVALMKASFDVKSGLFRVPTRVFVRDGFLFKDSDDSGGGVALRWGSALQIMGGVGLVERQAGQWAVTEEGSAA